MAASSSSSLGAAEPQFTSQDASALCSLGMRPLLMTGYFRQLLGQSFADQDNREDPQLKDLLWTTKLDTSTIQIESITRWKPVEAERRPAIVIRRNAWQVRRLGIDDILMGSWEMDGFDRYTTSMTGSHTLFCIAYEGAEAEVLAAEVYRYLIAFGPLIRKDLDLLRFVVTEVGPLSELQNAAEAYVVPVTVAYAHLEQWIIRPHVPVLRRISISNLLQL